jgi:hypothetical protein
VPPREPGVRQPDRHACLLAEAHKRAAQPSRIDVKPARFGGCIGRTG